MNITEVENKKADCLKPIKERMDIYIPGIDTENIPNRNGFITLFSGAPGSGKSSLMLGMLQNKAFYRKKFNHIHYFCPQSSMLSVLNHPLKKLETTYHELSAPILDALYTVLSDQRAFNEEEGNETSYSLIVLDDMADLMKDIEIVKALKRILIKSRHICCAVMITVQSYLYLDASLRKLLTNVILFKPNTRKEWDSLCDEHLANLTKEERIALERYAFSEKYAHLDIDTKAPEKDQLARNFNSLQLERA